MLSGSAMTDDLEVSVAAICTSASFRRSARLQRFLRYIVEKACSGGEDGVKEYAIALAVYDKSASFDPQLDPIVRVEAGRLRSRLLEYYAGPGRDDAVVIELPKGTYVPVIRLKKSAAAPLSSDSIAVIPWKQSSDPDQQYLIEGIAEALTIRFAKIAKVRVAPWSMVLATTASQRDLLTTAQILGARTLLVLSAKANDSAYEVHAEWMDPEDKTHLWGKRYERNRDEIASLEDEIYAEVAEQIVPGAKRERIERRNCKRHIKSGHAYQLYLKGRYLWNKRTPDALVRAIRHYRQALDLEPVFALALAGMADAYLTLGTFLFLSPEDSFPRAKEAAARALEIDQNLGEARATLACARAVYDWEWKDADRQFQESIAMEPTYSVARQWYGFCLCALGDFDAGHRQLRSALVLDPLSPMIETQIAAAFYLARRYDEAVRICEKVLDTDPYFWAALFFLGLCQDSMGRCADAITSLRKASEFSGGTPLAIASLSHALARHGIRDEATSLLSNLEARASTEYVPAYSFALIACGLERNDEAIEYLEEAYRERSPAAALWLKGEPRLDPLRKDHRFQVLLQSMHLA
jgi:TolB-like protein/Flp pilus assembly protein TadD